LLFAWLPSLAAFSGIAVTINYGMELRKRKMMRPNKIRSLLQNGRPTLGTRVQNISPTIVEVLGHAGVFDYVEFLAEYAAFTLPELENFCRAAELYDLGTMIKVDAEPRQFLAQRAIGAGFQSVLFADSRTVEDVRACVCAVRPDTPDDGGTHGAAMRRFTFMGYGGGPEYVQALRDVVVVMMIEKYPAVDHLEAVLSVPGIDMVQWGPADYAMSIGAAGSRQDSRVTQAERKVIDTCLRMGIPPRIEIHHPEQAAPYLDLGVRHFNLGVDLNILFNWWRGSGETMRRMLGE
jgi:4-hydroxy-2-oxoheptanedioate aldolase